MRVSSGVGLAEMEAARMKRDSTDKCIVLAGRVVREYGDDEGGYGIWARWTLS